MTLPDTKKPTSVAKLRTWWGNFDLSKRALFGVLLLLLFGLLVKSLFGVLTSVAIFTHPFQLDESEGMIVAETMLLDKGTAIYTVPGPELFISAPYPPLYYLFVWPFQHLAGATPTFKAGRAISILSTIAAGVAIFGIVVALTKQKLAGAIAAAAWWSLGIVTFWGGLVKPDMMALAFGLGGLWWLVARPPAQMWWALPFFWAAFYSKQTAIAAVVASIGWLLLTQFKRGIIFGVAYAAGVALPTILFNWITAGGYFYHMFTIHDLPWSLDRTVGFVGNFLGTYGLLLAPGMLSLVVGAVLVFSTRVRKRPQPIMRDGALLLFFYLGMSIFSASGTGTLGGNHNHLLEWAAASCLGLGIGIHLLWGSTLRVVRFAGALAGASVLVSVPLLFAVPTWLKLEFGMLSTEKVEGMTHIFQYVTNNSGRAYSDNVGLLLTAGKPLWTTDPYTQTHATFFKRWDQSKLVAAIESKTFSQVILRIDIANPELGAGDVSPQILQAVRDNYKLDQRNVENIYVPK